MEKVNAAIVETIESSDDPFCPECGQTPEDCPGHEVEEDAQKLTSEGRNDDH
jgi:hypothetical protein